MAADARPCGALAVELAQALLTNTDSADFHPESEWIDLGLLVHSLETRGLYLMLNSAARDGRMRRIASLHRETDLGYPCIGSSEWGYFSSVGEAVLRAAHEAILHPRA